MYNPKHAVAAVRKVLSTRGRITAAVASLALLGGGAAFAAASAGAATANCPTCTTFSSQAFGAGNVLNANNKSNIRLRNLSNTYTNEDFVIDGTFHTVSWFVSHGLISSHSYAAINYPNFEAFQLETAPNGVPGHQCVGLAAPAFNGEGVTKQPCGVNAQTLWVFDHTSGEGGNCLTAGTYCPLFNGSDSKFTDPEALTATSSSFQLHVTTENNDGPGSEAGDTQQFVHN